MYEDLTPEAVKARILARLDTELLTCEGSFTGDIIAAIALELSECYHAMDALVPAFYVDEGSGPYIDRQAAMVGVVRKKGTTASCAIAFTGSEGAALPAGAPFYTAGGLTFYLEEGVTLGAEGAVGTLRAAGPGAAYNIRPGEIVSALRNYSGVTGYTNGAATGGSDPETDASLVGRYYARMRRPPTSGNAYHYQMWAEEVDGVGMSRVIAKWAGPGTVKVLLTGADLGPADGAVVRAAAEHIEAEKPVGPAVTVAGAEARSLPVAAAVTLDGSTAREAVQAALAAAVNDYFHTLVQQSFSENLDAELDGIDGKTYTVLYNRVAFLLLSIPGVVDYTALTVGGGTANIAMGAWEVPVLTEVTIT